MEFRHMALAATAAVFTGATAMAGPVGLIDDYSGDLSAYTSTVILDANGGGSNTAAWEISGGALQLTTTAYDGIEQYAMIHGGVTLDVGEEVQLDASLTGSQDLGLYVGGTTPVVGTRQDYIAVYARGGDDRIFSRGFDGTSEYPLSATANLGYTFNDTLFIARTGVNAYEAGYYEGATRNVLVTRTPTFANDGDVVGIYGDVRAAGTVASVDNLRIIPEPASLALIGLGGVLMLARRR